MSGTAHPVVEFGAGQAAAGAYEPDTLRDVLGSVVEAVRATRSCVRVATRGPVRVVEAGTVQQVRAYASAAFPGARMVGAPMLCGTLVSRVKVTFDLTPLPPPATVVPATATREAAPADGQTRGLVIPGVNAPLPPRAQPRPASAAEVLLADDEAMVVETSRQPPPAPPPNGLTFAAHLDKQRRLRLDQLPDDTVVAAPRIPDRFRTPRT